MKFPSIHWKATLLTLWVIFSFVYISYSIFDNFRTKILQNAYVAGQTDTVTRLIEQASNKECKPFNVYVGEKKVDLINITCLQQTPKNPIESTSSVLQK